MWLGEQVTERGIGNGTSLIIFSSIVSGIPRGIANYFAANAGEPSPPFASCPRWWRRPSVRRFSSVAPA